MPTLSVDLTAAITSPIQKLKPPRKSLDRSAPLIEPSAAARRSVDPALLDELRSPQRQQSTGAGGSPKGPALDEAEVWVRDPDTVWAAGKVERQLDNHTVLVKTAEGASVKVDLGEGGGQLLTCNPTTEQDMTSLWYLHEPGVLHNLKGRYAAEPQCEPYTYVAHLLTAVNPLRQLPMPPMESVRDAASLTSVAPHPYSVAERAYRALQLPKAAQSQSIVVSGESGAGKTESTKIILRYLAWRARSSSSLEDGATYNFNEKVIQSNPILESLGNGKTVRNHNSSRFGKYLRLNFSPATGFAGVAASATGGGHLATPLVLRGGRIDTYLLEKSRLVYQSSGERNFHCFYEMLSGGSAGQLSQWQLAGTRASDYHYLNTSGCVSVAAHDDVAEFHALAGALTAIGASEETKTQLFACLAACLHLGNIGLVEEDEDEASGANGTPSVVLTNPTALAAAARQLGLSPASLEAALTTRTNKMQRGDSVESFTVKLDATKAAHTRDGLAKAVYGALFEWAVTFINGQLEGGGTKSADAPVDVSDAAGGGATSSSSELFIGLLDIFGFEAFATNSFEQLLINFANEKLQATFNKHVFTAEQELYASEGISWRSVQWPDNAGCIALIAERGSGGGIGGGGSGSTPPGLLHLIDEVCRLPRTTDAELHTRLHDTHSGNPFFPRPERKKAGGGGSGGSSRGGFQGGTFTVKHYAGEVTYTVDGFLAKNNDTLSNDLTELCLSSSHDLLASTFSNREALKEAAAVARESKADAKIAARAHSMSAMVADLDSTRCNFVRCIKPNFGLERGVFDAPYVVTQLRHTGLLQCCELLKHGYPTRIAYAEVATRYTPVLPASILSVPCLQQSERLLTSAVLYGFEVEPSLYQLGMTRLFFRAGAVAALDDIRNCDMATRGPRVLQRVTRWVVLRRWRLALAHTQMGLALQRLHQSVVAQRSWLFATRVLRAYNRSFRKLYRKQLLPRKAIVLQAAARALGPRRAFLAHTATRRAEQAAKAQAAREGVAARRLQAVVRGLHQRAAYRAALAERAAARVRPPAATRIQTLYRALRGRREGVRRKRELLELLTPKALVLQRWWRVVLSEKILRKLRSVVERASAGHRALVEELVTMKETLARDEKALADAASTAASSSSSGAPSGAGKNGGKRFEMWISLKVGLGPDGSTDAASPPSFPGQQVFAVRTAVLKREGTFLKAFFSDASNVDGPSRDADGHYLVHRSWKHFGSLLEYMRDGACALPTAYVPATYDNRPASSEEAELREFAREAAFFGLRPLVEQAVPKLLKLRYGDNATMLGLLAAKGLLA